VGPAAGKLARGSRLHHAKSKPHAGVTERVGVDVLFAIVGPHDAGRDRHRLAEGVLGLAGADVVEDFLAGLPAHRLL